MRPSINRPATPRRFHRRRRHHQKTIGHFEQKRRAREGAPEHTCALKRHHARTCDAQTTTEAERCLGHANFNAPRSPAARDEAGGTRANERPSRREVEISGMTEANFLPTASGRSVRDRKEGQRTEEGSEEGDRMMFLVQIAMTILIIGRPLGLSCFSCRRGGWERVGASECACIGYYTGH